MVVFIPTWVTLVGWLRIAHLMINSFLVSTATIVRMIATSRKLGDTVPSWFELFLELVLIDRWVTVTDGQNGIKQAIATSCFCA